MKTLLGFVFLLVNYGSVQSSDYTYDQCCMPHVLIGPRGICEGDVTRINRNCTNGHMLLKEIVLNGYKLYTLDAPNYIFAEDPNEYCIGKMYKNFSDHSQGIMDVAVVCFEKIKGDEFETTGVLTLTSVIFLIATLAVYMYLPQMRDLQGSCYVCMCISMALGFMSLGILQLSPGFTGQICAVTGFLVYFWMIATFFWMNVICINMYRTVQDATYLKKTERKQYFWYSCYAWGSSAFLLIVSLSTNFIEGNHWKPGIGDKSCWFSGRTETWIFFYGPIAILIVANIVLFILSSISLWKETKKYEVNSLNILKHKFLLSLKLFLVMGISWIFEIASFAHGEWHIIWKIMDTFNCLQGVIIFILLVVLRRRAIRGLASEGCCLIVTRPLVEKLNPHDDIDEQQILDEENMEVRLN